ncbi:MAG: amidase, partial [Pirellulaceae bacterium]|nr:amidase [Pirellulaceae bacterium]
SSSGSAAAVAMEMCLAALGTQTGGSIIRPASYCGVVGLKPDFGHPTLEGVFPFSRHLDHLGPIGRSVADAKLVQEVLYPELQLPKRPLKKLCFLAGGFVDQADDVTQKCLAAAQEKLSVQFTTESFPLPEYFRDVHALHRCIMAVEASDIHRECYKENPERYSHHIRDLIEEGQGTIGHVYARALRRQAELKSQFFGNWGNLKEPAIFVMPSTATAAPGIDSTGNPLFNSPWSFLGVPEITIPMGVNSEGLPLGIQFITFMLSLTPAFFEAVEECETIIGFKQCPRLLSQS